MFNPIQFWHGVFLLTLYLFRHELIYGYDVSFPNENEKKGKKGSMLGLYIARQVIRTILIVAGVGGIKFYNLFRNG